MSLRKISSALISVFHKDGLEPIVREMHRLGITIYSTGGTQDFIEKLNIPVIAVEDLTGYPSIFGGRVKTLHPKVFGGILYRRDDQSDLDTAASFQIPSIDCVIVDLYPFEKTVASGASHEDIIEKIDIGGISLIRGAAKNYNDVVIVPSQKEYADLLHILKEQNGETQLEERKRFAKAAFDVSSHYDGAIYNYFLAGEIGTLKVSEQNHEVLRYGENPHQRGIFYGNLDAMFEKLNGKELSYNNLLDVDAAVNLIDEFASNVPAFAILKHNNACGVAVRPTVAEAYTAALECDPVSAFGGVLISNVPISHEACIKMHDLFCEVIIAPDFDHDGLQVLKTKANRIILKRKPQQLAKMQMRTLLNGILYQDKDLRTESVADFKLATTSSATSQQLEDLVFANKIVKHTKSNTIVIAKDGRLCASGTGQTSRVDALRQAIEKAKNFGFDLNGAVMASDAFFPFPDCVEIAGNEGINAVVQPGGSIKDQASVDYCNAHGIAMYMTGTRHFKH